MTNDKQFDLDTIVFDLNGTLIVWWELDDRIPWLILQLQSLWFRCVLLTGDQRWTALTYARYGLEIVLAKNAQQKKEWMHTIDSSKAVAIWNSRIDIGMFEMAKVRISTLQSEWIHTAIFPYVDIIVPSIVDAIMLFLDPDRFAATMKI
jgi:soluble P-type ATPase